MLLLDCLHYYWQETRDVRRKRIVQWLLFNKVTDQIILVLNAFLEPIAFKEFILDTVFFECLL